MQLGEMFDQGWDFLLIYIKHALYKISLSLEWYVDAIRRFYVLGMGTIALTMVGS
jgi:hypothetical protein